ncbi:MAG: HIRAN domain-containing protein [Longimicrobiales bacterium]
MSQFASTIQQAPPPCFRATVHGTVFCDRSKQVDRLEEGEEVLLLPDPPGQDDPAVWVHHREGDLIGHLPPEIGSWLVPWIRRGGCATAHTLRVSGRDVPSWRRLLIEVQCSGAGHANAAGGRHQ